MNKILVNVYVPRIEKKYDIFLPINAKMADAIKLIQQSISELSKGYYVVQEQVLLFDFLTGQVINTNNIVKFSGLRNGSNLLLL